MEKFYYMEDAHVGQKFKAGPVTVTAAEIIAFAKQFDPQPMHTDPAQAKKLMFGSLIASGWHTGSITMGLILEATPKMMGGMVGRNIEKMGWPNPVRPGDQLSVEVEVLEIRPSGKNPERGIMRTRNTTFNQKGEPVLEMDAVIFIPRRQKN
jgi:acyl dehydratase